MLFVFVVSVLSLPLSLSLLLLLVLPFIVVDDDDVVFGVACFFWLVRVQLLAWLCAIETTNVADICADILQ